MLKRSALTALVLAGFAGAAFAQDFGSRPTGIMGGAYNSANQQTLLRQSMTKDAQTDVTPEQRRRAKKAVALIKANHCQDAYNMALAEQDNRLALNIAVACKAQLRQ